MGRAQPSRFPEASGLAITNCDSGSRGENITIPLVARQIWSHPRSFWATASLAIALQTQGTRKFVKVVDAQATEVKGEQT